MLMLEILVENKQTLLSEINRYRLMYFGHIRHQDENKPQESNYGQESGGWLQNRRSKEEMKRTVTVGWTVDMQSCWELTVGAKHCQNVTHTGKGLGSTAQW